MIHDPTLLHPQLLLLKARPPEAAAAPPTAVGMYGPNRPLLAASLQSVFQQYTGGQAGAEGSGVSGGPWVPAPEGGKENRDSHRTSDPKWGYAHGPMGDAGRLSGDLE